MTIDIADLHRFYASPLGETAARHIKRLIDRCWSPLISQEIVVGYGYPLPYFSDFFGGPSIRPAAVLMPCLQGAMPWSEDGSEKNRVVLTQTNGLPFQDHSVDRLLIVHGLEHSDNPSHLLREAWRILVDGGRLLVIVPNRQGLWSFHSATPFGRGEPYSKRQIYELVQESLLTPSYNDFGLFMPPASWSIVLKTSETCEQVGRKCFPKMGGIILIEARKQAIALVGTCRRRRNPWRSKIFIPQTFP